MPKPIPAHLLTASSRILRTAESLSKPTIQQGDQIQEVVAHLIAAEQILTKMMIASREA